MFPTTAYAQQVTSTSTSTQPSNTSQPSNATDNGLLAGQKNNRLQVVIPIVAGVVILAIAAMMIFIKCAANRQSSKRGRKRGRKRGEAGELGMDGEGFEYEGVPA
jgi:hypothetical protein